MTQDKIEQELEKELGFHTAEDFLEWAKSQKGIEL